MKKNVFLLCFLMCLICTGCRIQFGSNIIWAIYRETPAEAYMDVPYTDHITHTYLDIIDKEIVCVPVSNEEVLWVAVLNGNHVIEMPMRINEKNKYCSLGNCMVHTVDSEKYIANNQEIVYPSKSFELVSGEYIYSYFYTESEYYTIEEQLEDKYSAIPFSVELEDEVYNLVYVYAVK